MPAYNAEEQICCAINSVIAQDHKNWELIIVDDGSTDDTLAEIKKISDDRIRILQIDHGGVSAARNAGLKACRGKYICFLDADDELPQCSISARSTLLDNDPSIEFADGKVLQIDAQKGTLLDTYLPRFSGKVINELLRYRSSCFCGNTWMIRKMPDKVYQFKVGLSHAEDIHFYLSIADHGKYGFTTEPVLHYLRRSDSAMKNINGMEKGLYSYLRTARQHKRSTPFSLIELKYRLIRGVCGSYLKDGQFTPAAKAFLRFLFP